MSARRNCLLFPSYVFRFYFLGEKSGKDCCARRAIFFFIHDNNYIKMIETLCARTASTPERCKAEWLFATISLSSWWSATSVVFICRGGRQLEKLLLLWPLASPCHSAPVLPFSHLSSPHQPSIRPPQQNPTLASQTTLPVLFVHCYCCHRCRQTPGRLLGLFVASCAQIAFDLRISCVFGVVQLLELCDAR